MTHGYSLRCLSFALPSLLFLFAYHPDALRAQPIIINEVYNSSSTDEWVELLVVRDSLDIRGWDLRDYTSSGAPFDSLAFTSNSLWSLLRKGTVIVVGTPTTTFIEDTDPSDRLLLIKSNNSTYFTGTVFLFAGSSDAIQIRNSSATHIFGVSWGANNANKLPAPEVHFSAPDSSNRSNRFNGNDTTQLTSTSNWSQYASPTLGVGNTPTNSAWISALRAHPDGSGIAIVKPDTMKHGLTYNVTINYHRDTAFTVTDMRIILPFNFVWSHSTSDVSSTNITATKSISGDTIYFNTITFSADSSVITVQSVTAPDSTAYYPVDVQTKAQIDYDHTTPIPQIVLLGLPVTVGQVKGNDANGYPLRAGNLVTVSGVITVANQFGSPSYIQDNTGGIAIFGTTFSTSVQTGDEVIVTGKIDPFNGLTEMTSPKLDSIVSSGNAVTPVVLTCSQVANDGSGGLESYEGLLVRINATLVRDLSNNPIASWAVSGAGTNYRLTDGSGNLDVRVDNNVSYANTPAPQGTFDIFGVVSQFKSTSPYIGGYQLMPRDSTDILAKGPIITTLPYETNITRTSLTINWTTAAGGTSRLRYGATTAYELGLIEPDTIHRTVHAIDLTGLTPATIYHVLAFSTGSDTSFAGDLVVSTSSPAGTTGTINVYFNKTVNTSVSFGENALGSQDLISRINTRIDNAQRSIDLALYSLSAVNQGNVIATHLINAKNRGVKLRVICENDNYGTGGSSFPSLVSAGIPLITDTYDPVWNGQGLSHNKFFVIDGRGGAPESIWVFTGSWNPTNSGTTSDRQNSIEIQDVALAGAYETEFNVMWGSDTDTPNQTNSRFGGRKPDVVPHNFLINGIPVSVYFSPSDHTTSHIRSTMAKAQNSIGGCILTFTRKDIADTIITKKNQGRKTRVVVDNNTDTGNQFAYLQTNGVDIHLKGGSGLLHHKYAIVDADQVAGTQYVVTGSHNWSNSAETSNDENTLILQDRRIANLYLQEFVARYYEAGGTDSIQISSSALFSEAPSSINFGNVVSGGSKQDSFTVSNPGNLSLSISGVTSSNARFTVSPANGSVAATGSMKFYVTFSPLVAGAQSASIVLAHNAPGSPDTVSVQGTGTGALQPHFSVSPLNLNFGTVPLNVQKQDSLIVSNSGNATLVISSATSTNSKFSIAPSADSAIAGGSKKFVVTFLTDSSGPRNGYIIFTHNAPGSPDSVPIQGTGGVGSITDTIGILTGWNMVSLPLIVANAWKGAVFPTAVTHVFAYNGGYNIPPGDTLRLGKGYWAKFDTTQSVYVTGAAVSSYPIPVAANWNMIGSLSYPVPRGSIIQNPSNIIRSQFFGYNGSYAIADTIRPGMAYWVKVSQGGTLTLSSASAVPGKAGSRAGRVPDALNKITITDSRGAQQTLYFGDDSSVVDLNLFALPPVPPPEAFDARFRSGDMVELVPRAPVSPAQIPITVQSQAFPLTVSWDISSQDSKRYSLKTGASKGSAEVRMTGKGRTIVNAALSELTLTVAPPAPDRYLLQQNYPNPFNPITTIPFGVPRRATLTLKIFNILGEVVSVLFRNQEYDAGYYTVSFDATRLASGVYYYELAARESEGTRSEFRQVKKLMLLK